MCGRRITTGSQATVSGRRDVEQHSGCVRSVLLIAGFLVHMLPGISGAVPPQDGQDIRRPVYLFSTMVDYRGHHAGCQFCRHQSVVDIVSFICFLSFNRSRCVADTFIVILS